MPGAPLNPSFPPDARRAAARSRDAVRAAYVRAGLRPGVEAPRVEVAEPEAAVPTAGLARAISEAAARPTASLVPGGAWAGGPFPAEEPYVTAWELRLLSETRAAGTARSAPAAGRPPLRVTGSPGTGPPEAFSPWFVHSFSGRKDHARPEVAALVPASARTVLDVGCGEGALGAALEAGGARVTGIELDPKAARVAAGRLSRVLALAAEEAVEVLEERPDVVVLADVVEHLTRPSAVLRAVRGILPRGGLLVFSLPNATHASVLGGALRGRWDRELEGIVADDHRTYAGRAGWSALLAACGFRVTSLRPVPARTRFSEGDRTAFLASTRLAPDDLDAVQWLGTAVPSVPGSGADVRGAEEGVAPLESEDPVAAVASTVAAGGTFFTARNSVRGEVLDALIHGGLVAGEEATDLLSGWTAAGLSDRFEGSGFRLRVDAASSGPLPRGLLPVIDARRVAGLPTDEASLSASGWAVRVDATAGPALRGPCPGPADPERWAPRRAG